MKNIVVMLAIILTLLSCNKETVLINGKLCGFDNSKVELRLKSKGGVDKLVMSDITLKDEEFETSIVNRKPPFKLTLVIDQEKEFTFWVFRYGKLCFELDSANLNDIKIHDCFENSELSRVNETYDEMYIKPLQEQIDWINNYKSAKHEVINDVDEEKLGRYMIQIKKAYRLRKKSILKTIRKAPQNPISMALFFDEFESLTKWQKKECFKLAQKYYSDTGMNWQLKH